MAATGRDEPVLTPAQIQASVRPAVLNRPLVHTRLESHYADPRLEEMVRRAAEQARLEAQAQGYLAGWAQGRQAAAQENARVRAAAQTEQQQVHAQIRQEAQGLLAALREADQQVHESRMPEWTEVADVLADGALQLARAALGRELASVDDRVRLAVQAALRQVGEHPQTVVRLSPEDAQTLAQDPPEGIEVVADPELSSGSVVVLTPAQRLRQDLPAALAAAEEVLRS